MSVFRFPLKVQRQTKTADGAGGYTFVWTTDVRIACRIADESDGPDSVKERPAQGRRIKIQAGNQIPYSSGHTTLDAYLRDSSLGRIRFLLDETRTLTYEGHVLAVGRPIVTINSFETENRGYPDQT